MPIPKVPQVPEKDVFVLLESFKQGTWSLFEYASSSVEWVNSVVPQKVVLRIKTSLSIWRTCTVPSMEGASCASSFHSSWRTNCISCFSPYLTKYQTTAAGERKHLFGLTVWERSSSQRDMTGEMWGGWSHGVYSKRNKTKRWTATTMDAVLNPNDPLE